MAKQSPEGTAIVATSDLEPKSTSSRPKGKATFEAILASTGELLAKVGSNVSTPIASASAQASLRRRSTGNSPINTPILDELARRLMEAHDEVFFAWLDRGDAAARTLDKAAAIGIELRTELLRVTRNQPGGMSILRAIRSAPALRQVRIEPRDRVIARQMEVLRELVPDADERQLQSAVRLSEELGYAVIEMILEDPSLDEERVIAKSAWMNAVDYQHLGPR